MLGRLSVEGKGTTTRKVEWVRLGEHTQPAVLIGPWWAYPDSNGRPRLRQRRALPAELYAPGITNQFTELST